MKDLELLSANFLSCELNKDDEFLTHYFPDANQQRLIIYYKIFGYAKNKRFCFLQFWINFCDHTGIFCSKRWTVKHITRIRYLESELQKAERNFDFNAIEAIKTGKLKLKDNTRA